ncbi:MAG: NHLP leader peptide family natural product precursor [Rhodospirillaceae bacterium]|nr:NHLP leader peptide family natural product precursor [Rhodospirillales bacterium]
MSTFETLLTQREAAYRTLVLKAQQDPAFRQLLKTDPAAAVKQVFGQDWDSSVKIEVVEETADRCVLVLPALFPRADNDDELSDEDLELVAAGVMMPPQFNKTSGGTQLGRLN